MASETRTAAESIRKSAREVMQAYRAGRSLDGDDVGNVAYDLEDAAAEIARLTRELEEARERERAVRDEATGYLVEVAGTLADMHDGEECRFEGGDGCLACYAQGRIGEMQDALAARTTTTEGER